MSSFKSLYLQQRCFVALGALALSFVLGHFAAPLLVVGRLGLLTLLALVVVDAVLLFRVDGVNARRHVPARLSNGDDNAITVDVANVYPFTLRATVLEELPFQFQIRDARHDVLVPPGRRQEIHYTLRPTRRGVYDFGALNVYAGSPLGLVSRRYRFDEGREVPVYPSFLQMRRYELLAASNRLEEAGVKKLRRVGHTMEFDQVREYVLGDDPRTINWKATARHGDLMVNQYRDERSQPVYCVIDTGRVMKMPFEGMTLLDYSINASLVVANIALQKQDRAGLATFSHRIGAVVAAERKPGHIYRMQEALYRIDTDFLESDFAMLAAHLRRSLPRRSLLLLFTNFETRTSMRRQLPYLRALSRQHVVVVIFFENTELRGLLDTTPERTEEVYTKTIAEKFAFEKREIVKELSRHGIHSVLTPPRQLSVRTINAYLALKARGVV